MKKLALLFFVLLPGILLFGQQKELAEKLVSEGVALHDAGNYTGAIVKYDEALRADENNLYALAEKAMTLAVIQKTEEAVKVCEIAIKEHKESDLLYMVYVIYGNAKDELGDNRGAIEIYNEGIEQFPDFYQLHFNKGITLLRMERQEEAIISFQKSASLNPNHPGSHSAIGRTLYEGNKLIPSLLAFAKFFVLEPEGDRARDNIDYIREIMGKNVKKTGDKSVNTTINADMFKEGEGGGENSFSSVELILGLNGALDYEEEYKDETETERFIRKFKMVCSVMGTQIEENNGFYWKYYAPFFVEMNGRDMVETFGYIVFASSGNGDVLKWIEANEDRIISFYEWVDGYKW